MLIGHVRKRKRQEEAEDEKIFKEKNSFITGSHYCG